MKSPLGRIEYQSRPHYQDRMADLIRQEKPLIVVETGLETGIGAEYILHALDDNGKGDLFSIDPVIDLRFDAINHPRFHFFNDYSQVVLPDLFKLVGQFDFFIHDSDHGPECQDFEYEFAWNHVRLGGIIATDDPFWGIPPHMTWSKFLERHSITNPNIAGNAQWIRR